MSDGISIDMAQVDELAGKLAAAGTMMAVASEAGLEVAGRQLQERAKADAPFRTGELREGIYLHTGVGEATVGTDVEHGFYQEFGTSKMGPHPFLLHNAEAASTLLVTKLSAAVDKSW